MVKASSAASFQALTRQQRRSVVLRSTARCLALTVLVIAAYFLWPVEPQSLAVGEIARGVFAGVAFLAVLAWQLRRIVEADLPEVRAVETIIVIAVLFIALVASIYVGLSASDPGSFTQPIDKVTGLYFATTVLTTVGFGDISPVTSGARIAVTIQMVVDLVILAFLARVIFAAARSGLQRASSAE